MYLGKYYIINIGFISKTLKSCLKVICVYVMSTLDFIAWIFSRTNLVEKISMERRFRCVQIINVPGLIRCNNGKKLILDLLKSSFHDEPVAIE